MGFSEGFEAGERVFWFSFYRLLGFNRFNILLLNKKYYEHATRGRKITEFTLPHRECLYVMRRTDEVDVKLFD
jgi:hypothetical protein